MKERNRYATKYRTILIKNTLLPLVGYSLGMLCLYASVWLGINDYSIATLNNFLYVLLIFYAILFWIIFKREIYTRKFSNAMLTLHIVVWILIFSVWDFYLASLRPIALILCFLGYNFVVLYSPFVYTIFLSLLIALIHLGNTYIGINYFQQNDSLVHEVFYTGIFLISSTVVAYHTAQVSKRVRAVAATDGLTRLYNRRHFSKLLKEEFNRCQRYHYKSCLLLLDVDRFKSINDRFGHELGDRVLIQLANCLNQNLRSTDVAGRWGGEEFIVLLVHTDCKGASNFGERVLADLGSKSILGLDSESVTFSGGISEINLFENIDQAIGAADELLYLAKDSGRKQIRHL